MENNQLPFEDVDSVLAIHGPIEDSVAKIHGRRTVPRSARLTPQSPQTSLSILQNSVVQGTCQRFEMCVDGEEDPWELGAT